MEKKPISRQGFDALMTELKDLKENQRPEILKIVQWARSLGDLSEKADYSAAKEKQRQIDKRIQFIEDTIENAQVIDIDSLSGNRVVFGAKVITLKTPLVECSSTEIRKKLQSGGDVSQMLCPEVYEYVKTNHLYGSRQE